MSGDAAIIESIRLPGGWTGRVVTRWGPPLAQDLVAAGLPTGEQWRAYLGRLVVDPAALPGYETLKYSKDGRVFRARLDLGGDASGTDSTTAGLDIIAKQSRPRHLGRRVAAALGRTRERRNFERGLSLLRAGIKTAPPLALIERKRPRREAWLVTTYLPHIVDLAQIVLGILPSMPGRLAHRVKCELTTAIVDTLVMLAQNGLTHRDFKASNILVQGMPTDTDSADAAEAGLNVSVWLVDLDGLQRSRRPSTSRCWHPIVRLGASLLGSAAVTRTDYARFLKRCIARGVLPGADWRGSFRKMSHESRTYAARAARRKTGKLDGFTGGT
jgi:hypothetical protein